MKEIQLRPTRTGLEPAATTILNVPQLRPEAPGAGLKRDYAGVLEYWQMVRRHKLMVAFAAILGGTIGFALTLPEPRIFQARITLEIQGLNQDFLNMRNVNPTMTATSNEYPDYDIQTQVRILQSRTLIRRVREKLEPQKPQVVFQPPDRLGAWRKILKLSTPTQEDLWKEALGTAAGSVRVRASGTNRIVEVSADSTNPRVASEFLNLLAKEYIEENLEARWKSTEYTGEWLSKQLQDLKINLEKAEDELQGYANATGLVFTDEKTNINDSRLEDYQKELSSAQSDRIAKQSKYEMAMASSAESLPDVLDDITLKDSQGALSALRTKYAQLRVAFTPNHPDVRSVQAQITSLESTLQAERGKILTRIKNDYEAAVRRESLLSANYNAQTRRVSSDAAKIAHYSLLKRDVDANRAVYEAMSQKLKEASVASALRANNIRVVDAAEPAVRVNNNETHGMKV